MITLTTAFNPGDIDPGVTYANVKIIEFRCNIQGRNLTAICEYGNDDAGEWTPGKIQVVKVPVSGSEYDTLVANSKTLITDEATPSDGGHNVYVGAGRNLYQWLIDEGKFIGTAS